MKQLSFSEYAELKRVERAAWGRTTQAADKCLLGRAPVKWDHPKAQEDLRLVAGWCGCRKCYHVIFDCTVDYRKVLTNGKT